MTDISFFLHVAESDTESENSIESEEFWKLVSSSAQITKVYVDMYLEKKSNKDTNPEWHGLVSRDTEDSGCVPYITEDEHNNFLRSA
jgi:hypothetical protein